MTRIPLSWLGEFVDIPESATAQDVANDLVRVGLEEEAIHLPQITGPLVVGRVLSFESEPQKNGKTINWCSVDVGDGEPRGIVCGAHNFAAGDRVVVALPGAVLPGPFPISARKTYGHISDGMICSVRELGIGDDHTGILVLGSEYDEFEIGADAIAMLGLDEEIVEVNVTPDRGYCLSMRGIAREYSHATGANFHDPAHIEAPAATSGGFEVLLADSQPIDGTPGCDRFVARVVRGVSASAPSPAFMQRRLQQAGMRPISLAVDVTNYVMLELGQPLHAYDLSKLASPIVVRRAKSGEKLKTIDAQVRELDTEDLVITDSPTEQGTRVLGLAGVMGGFDSEVTESTTDLLIEGAHFDAVSVARTSRRFRLTSEASKRFERGVDHDLAPIAVERVVQLLVEYGGGVADSHVTDTDERDAISSFEFEVAQVERVIGVSYTPAQIRETLEEIGARVTGEIDSAAWQVTAPSWRPDLQISVDLVEEIARLRGYDAIPSRLPTAPAGRGLTHEQRARRSVSRTLAEAGLNEVLSYPFIGAGVFDALQYADDDERRRALRILNPLRGEEPYMRTSVLATLLPVLRRNVGRGLTDVSLFEVGMVTWPSEEASAAPIPPLAQFPGQEALAAIEKALPQQPLAVAGVVAGLKELPTPGDPGRAGTWRDAIDLGLRAARALGVDLIVRSAEIAPWHPGRCAELVAPNQVVVGYAGELHPKAISALELPERTVAFELNLETLIASSSHEPVRSKPISTYPAGKEDLALIVSEQVPSAAVQQAILDGAGELVEEVRLFDVYRGPQIGSGKKSLAFALRYRAPDKTLTAQELETARTGAIRAAEQEFDAVLRG